MRTDRRIRRLSLLLGMLPAAHVNCADDPGQTPPEALSARDGVAYGASSGGTVMTAYEDTLPSCDVCKIHLWPVAEFGSLRDPVLLRGIPIVERDDLKRFYATVALAHDHELIQYAPHSDTVRTIGRRGNGPGEFQVIWDILMGAADTLYVGHDNRVSMFDSTGAFVRSVRLDPARGLFARSFVWVDSSQIILTEARRSEIPVPPLQIYDQRGRHVDAVGPASMLATHHRAVYGAASPHVHGQRIVRYDTSGSVWLAGGLGGYRLENIDINGRVRRVIGVASPAEWNMSTLLMTAEEALTTLPTGGRPPAGSGPLDSQQRRARVERRPSASPPAVIRAIGVLADGLILVVLHVPSRDWRTARVSIDRTRHPATAEPGYFQQLYDTILDVVEIRAGKVLARKRVSGTLQLTSDGVLYQPMVSQTGVIQVKAFEVEFIGADSTVR